MKLCRRSCLNPALLACVSLIACGGQSAAPTGPTEVSFAGENLLLITVDTLRADRLGAYGDRGGATPYLNELEFLIAKARGDRDAALATDHQPLEPEQQMLARETLARIRGT